MQFNYSTLIGISAHTAAAAPVPQLRRSRQSLERANQTLSAGLHGRAVDLYTSLLAEDPEWVEARQRRAAAYLEMGEGQKALDDLDLVLRAEPANGEAQRMRGDLMLERDRAANAVESYSRALQAGLATSAVCASRGAA
ncbi:MAG: hypothetical protein FJW31_10305 [Acidobacteria bacterium]|nr:hypothetical protein [Acidobacteriota bacterium]